MDDENFKFRLITKYSTPSSSLQSHINFNFRFEFKISEFVLNQDSTTPQFIAQNDFSEVSSTTVTSQKFLFFPKTHQALYEETREAIERLILTNCPLFDRDMREQLIEFAWIEAWRSHVRSKKTSCSCCSGTDLNLHFLVQIKDILVFDPSLESESETCMVPSADSAIQSLEKYEIDSGNITEFSCCICLEGFSGEGCVALSMPCSHVFHGDCIEKWLSTSHYCPICRFELPMSDGDEQYRWISRVYDLVDFEILLNSVRGS